MVFQSKMINATVAFALAPSYVDGISVQSEDVATESDKVVPHVFHKKHMAIQSAIEKKQIAFQKKENAIQSLTPTQFNGPAERIIFSILMMEDDDARTDFLAYVQSRFDESVQSERSFIYILDGFAKLFSSLDITNMRKTFFKPVDDEFAGMATKGYENYTTDAISKLANRNEDNHKRKLQIIQRRSWEPDFLQRLTEIAEEQDLHELIVGGDQSFDKFEAVKTYLDKIEGDSFEPMKKWFAMVAAFIANVQQTFAADQQFQPKTQEDDQRKFLWQNQMVEFVKAHNIEIDMTKLRTGHYNARELKTMFFHHICDLKMGDLQTLMVDLSIDDRIQLARHFKSIDVVSKRQAKRFRAWANQRLSPPMSAFKFFNWLFKNPSNLQLGVKRFDTLFHKGAKIIKSTLPDRTMDGFNAFFKSKCEPFANLSHHLNNVVTEVNKQILTINEADLYGTSKKEALDDKLAKFCKSETFHQIWKHILAASSIPEINRKALFAVSAKKLKAIQRLSVQTLFMQ